MQSITMITHYGIYLSRLHIKLNVNNGNYFSKPFYIIFNQIFLNDFLSSHTTNVFLARLTRCWYGKGRGGVDSKRCQ